MATTTHKAAPPTPVGATMDVRRPRPIKPVLDGDTEVFCNREVNMQQIRAVGFDMDYTLAQYNLDFELLAYDGAKKKLVENLGYPVRGGWAGLRLVGSHRFGFGLVCVVCVCMRPTAL